MTRNSLRKQLKKRRRKEDKLILSLLSVSKYLSKLKKEELEIAREEAISNFMLIGTFFNNPFSIDATINKYIDGLAEIDTKKGINFLVYCLFLTLLKRLR